MGWTKEQQQAIDETGTNIIVSAGAGSGKTAVLTARTMRIINSGIHINELLILTFTKAAANEMKERIRKSIKKGIIDNPNLSEELDLIDQSYITTFDSFALSVVKKYHYLLNISNNIAISDSSIIEMQKVRILDEVFEEFYSQPNENFQKLIYDFCTKDDKDLKKSILSIANKIDALTNREEYLENYLNKYFSEDFINKCLSEYENILQEKIKEIDNLSSKLCLLTDGDFSTKLTEVITPLLNAKSLNEIINTVIAFNRLPSLPKGSEEEIKASKDNLKKAIDELKDKVLEYGNKEKIIENFNITKVYTTAIVEIITKFLDKLHLYKEQNEIYDFQDIALLSIKVLKENEGVRNDLKYSFKEIMIDEYQDTNDIQESFISMIENNNVYMVGDIKQSIYRFRNANPYIFKNKYDNYSQKNNGIKIDLVKNFRSRKEVLSNINDIFNLVMDNSIGGAEYHESHQMVYGNETYIKEGLTDYNYNLKILEYNLPEDKKYSKEEIEIFAIARDIQNKIKNKYQIFDKDEKILKNINYSDFVILMDRTSDFDLYKKIFEYLGIPLTLYKDEKLNNSEDIYILKNIIDLIIKIKENNYDQEFKYDFISIARSYLYSLKDDEIFEIFKNNDYKNNIIYQNLSPLSEKLNSLTIPELLENIIESTNMYEKIITEGNVDSFMIRTSKLLDIASNLSTLGYDIYTFKDYLKELLQEDYDMKYKASNIGSNSVKIMTIHASKGLEYHVCYYSGLYKAFNIRDLKERFTFDNTYGIITPFFNEGINESMIKYLVKYHYLEEEISEKIRLFYVALTRAKEQMIILNPCIEDTIYDKEKNNTIDIIARRKYRSFSDIINSIKYYLNHYFISLDINSLDITKDYLYNTKKIKEINKDISKPINVQMISSYSKEIIEKSHFSKNLHAFISKEIKANMEFGTIIHETLEYLDFKNPDLSLIENEFIKNKINIFLNHKILNNIENAKIYKEYEFIYEKENVEYHGIIDLMLEYPDYIDIIDYKLNNIKDDNYLKQLEGYKEYISSISNKKINLYLYSIISGTIEKI